MQYLKISIVLGTRPEIIKMSPIIRELDRLDFKYYILHTGQHYSYNMDKIFFEQLELPEAKYNLDVGSGSHAKQTGKMLIGIERIIKREPTDIVLVEGDTNSVLAGALAAYKLGITIGHVEAGLRCYDRKMPEEINRTLTDHCSDYLFAPTETSKSNLIREGIDENKIYVTGNTIVDAVHHTLPISIKNVDPLKDLNLTSSKYILATIHRQENVDNKVRFSSILKGLELVSDKLKLHVVYPVHPRALKMMKKLRLNPKIFLINPLDYLSFLQLEKNAALIMTDSGGVQEEACILGVPCVTLRDNTERPETIEVGSNMLAGSDPKVISKIAEIMIKKKKWIQPFGDGKSGKRITSIIIDTFPNT